MLVTGWTYTSAKLKYLLNRVIKDLDDAMGKPDYANIKPVDIIVVTDGAPSAYNLSLTMIINFEQ
jgi:hypothetical protein